MDRASTSSAPPHAELALGRRDHFTHRGNLGATRHGWLRLTPAYSVKLVSELLDQLTLDPKDVVLDPFCGTGTTALACAERGIACATSDINPFLLWFARAKTRRYSAADITRFTTLAGQIAPSFTRARGERWIPPLHQIEKWWPESTLRALGRTSAAIRALANGKDNPALDLVQIAFCQTLIAHARVSFGHQSMSFRRRKAGAPPADADEPGALALTFAEAVARIAESARSPITGLPEVHACDARRLEDALERNLYSCVITSPPYPNRMSYIRELRPYMYWLDYLRDGRSAGALDWQAIGGTWGAATSNLSRWAPPPGERVPHRGFATLLRRIAETSPLLSRYVEKYFFDMLLHARALFSVVAPGGRIHYIVGNSKFYEVLVPVEQIFASLFRKSGFIRTDVRAIRKRTSKKELYEFVVSAEKPLSAR